MFSWILTSESKGNWANWAPAAILALSVPFELPAQTSNYATVAAALPAQNGLSALANPAPLAKQAPSAQQQPNVVIIYGDDVGYADVSCYGDGKIQTPNIDRLASEGLRFTDGHCSASTCTPSRFSLLTGIHGFRHGVRILPPNAPMTIKPEMFTLPKLFQQAGYETAVIGKWHLGIGDGETPVDWNGVVKPGPLEIGFDYSFLMPSTNDRVPCVYLEDHQVVNLDADDPLYVGRKAPAGFDGTTYPDGKKNPESMTYYPSSHGHNNSVINGIGRIGFQWGGKSALWNDETMADVFVDRAKKWLEQQSADQPFFLYFSSQDIHVPRAPHPRFQGKTGRGFRGDAMAQLDWSTGAILQVLEDLELDDNTIVIFSSDNGPVYDDGYVDGTTVPTSSKEVDRGHDASGPYRGGKYQIYEGGTRVPLIIRWPGEIEPGESSAMVNQIDFTASFAAMLGVELESDQAIDSRDTWSAFVGEDSVGLVEMLEESGKVALRKGDWKYAEGRGKKAKGELFNLAEDPGEQKNQIAEHENLAEDLASMLTELKTSKDGLRADLKMRDVFPESEAIAPSSEKDPRGEAKLLSTPAEKPVNIVFIMSDELGYYELSCMGHPNIQTPNIDQLAAEGIRFTQLLAGSPLCAPTRGVLLTGKHSGHASVRSNGGGTPLRADEKTIASVLKEGGYATGGFGKWGCGGRGSSGVPEKHGFDTFVGYYDQVHAHTYYPPYILRNSEEIPLEGNVGGREGQTYSHYEIFDAAKEFIRDNHQQPFFCYLPVTPPHGMFDIPDDDPSWQIYKDKDWPEPARRYAALVSMVDRQVGEIRNLLTELGVADNTLIVFTGDNGGQDYFRDKDHPRGFHGPNVNPKTGLAFRGQKGRVYEGGLRIPAIAHMPGMIPGGQISDHLAYFPDLLPTFAELAGVKPPADIDGISFLPKLFGAEKTGRAQEQHEYLYWELGRQTAVRMGNWKAVQPSKDRPWELYDLSVDLGETTNVAASNAEVLAQMKSHAAAAHTPVQSGDWGDRTLHEKDRKAKGGQERRKGPSD